jgi:hypothetical protein
MEGMEKKNMDKKRKNNNNNLRNASKSIKRAQDTQTEWKKQH